MKFKIIKHYSLSHLGDEWKDAYLNFRPLSVADVKTSIPTIARLQDKDADIGAGLDGLIALLQEKFIDGKAVDDSGLAEVKKEDLADLPMEVINSAFGFLAESETPNSTTQ